MPGPESELKLKITAESSAVKPGLTPAAQAVTDLRTHVGGELDYITKISEHALDAIAEHLNLFVRERIPVGGGLFVNLTENVKQFLEPAKQAEGSILKLDAALRKIQENAGTVIQPFGAGGSAELFKFSPEQIKNFLVQFTQLGTQAEKDAKAVEFFGQTTAEKLKPQLEAASKELQTLIQSSAGAEAGLAGTGIAAGELVLPLLAAAAAAAIYVAATYEVISVSVEASKAFSEFGEQIGKAQDITKLSVDQLLGLKLVTAEASGSFEGLTLGIGRYLRAVVHAQREGGTGALAKQFEDLGVDITKLGDDPQKAIEALFAAFNRLGPSMQENAALQSLVGREALRNIQIFREAGGSLDDLAKKGRDFYGVTQQDIDVAKKEQAALADLDEAWKNLKIQVGKAYAPEILAFFTELTKTIQTNKEGVKFLFDAIGDILLGGTIQELFRNAKEVLETLNKIANGWIAIKTRTEEAIAAAKSFLGLPTAGAVPTPGTPTPTEVPPKGPQEILTTTQQQEQLQQFKEVYESTKEAVAASLSEIQRVEKKGDESSSAALRDALVNYGLRTAAAKQYFDAIKADAQARFDVNEEDIKNGKGHVSKRRELQAELDKIEADRAKDIDEINRGITESQDKFYERQKADAKRQIELRQSLDKEIQDGLLKSVEARRARGEIDANAELKAKIDKANADYKIDLDANTALTKLEGKYSQDKQALLNDRKKIEAKHNSDLQDLNDTRLGIAQASSRAQLEIAEAGAQAELSITRTKNSEILAEARALTAGLIVASQQLKTEMGLLAAQSDARIKAVNDDIANLEKQRAAITARGQVAGLSVEKQVAQEQLVNDQLERLYAARIHLYNEDVNAATNAHLNHEKLAQLETKLALDEKDKEIAIAEKEQSDLATKGLTPEDREKQNAAFNNKIRELREQRNAIEKAANIKAAEGREEDLNDLRAYEDAYAKLLYSGLALDEEVSRLQIRLLITLRAPRLAIVQAQFAEEQDQEEKHHAQQQARLEQERDTGLKRIKGQEDESRKRMTLLRQFFIDLDKENTRHEKAEAERAARQKREEALAGPGGGFFGGLNSGQLATLEEGVKSFADVSTVAMSAVGAAVNGLAQGVGNLVQNWVLMGTAGPDAARKMAASILASVASQAAVMAIMELAYGFAALTPWGAALYGPAVLHFKAAALFGAVAAISAVAGRAVAGNAFNQGGAGGGAAGGGGGSSTGGGGSSSQNPLPIVQGSQRQMVEHKVTVTIKTEPGFIADATVAALRSNHTQLTTHIQKVASRGSD